MVQWLGLGTLLPWPWVQYMVRELSKIPQAVQCGQKINKLKITKKKKRERGREKEF